MKKIEVSRLETNSASEEELISALEGKNGYFLGGLEKVTAKVIESADKLEAICFTGAGWEQFIPGHDAATKRGIPITSSPGANSQAVAEFALALLHDRVRHVSFLTGEGRGERIRARNMRELTVGIVGAGNVGGKVGRILRTPPTGRALSIAAPTRKLDFEYATGAKQVTIDEMVATADALCLHMSKTEATENMLDEKRLAAMRDDAIIINCAFGSAIDGSALLKELQRDRLSLASDADISGGDDQLLAALRATGTRRFIQSGSSTAYNSSGTIRVASDVATEAMISLLETGQHPRVVNPEAYQARVKAG